MVAEKQLLSLIKLCVPFVLLHSWHIQTACVCECVFLTACVSRTSERFPSNTDIMPVVDVSGSMEGTPMDVAMALGVIVACAQELVKGAVYKSLFATFHESPFAVSSCMCFTCLHAQAR